MHLSGAAVAAPFTVALAFGQDVPEGSGVGHLSLDTMVVKESSDTDLSASVIGPKVLERGTNFNLADAIKNEPDIGLNRRGRVGDYSDSLNIRGFSGNRILLNINGRPVNTAGVGGGFYIDWNTILLDNVERIEITRGGSSARYGNTLGGIINIITKVPTRKPEFSFFANYGTGAIDNMSTLRAAHSYKVGPIGYVLTGSHQQADAFLWNNDFEGRNASLFTTVDLPANGVLSFGFQYSNTEVGLIRNNRAVDQFAGDPEDPDDPGYDTPINPDYLPVTGVFLFPTVGHSFIPGTGSYVEKTNKLYDIGWTQPMGEGLLEAKVYWNDDVMRDRNYASCDIVWFTGDTCATGTPAGALVLDQTVETDRSRGARLEYAHVVDAHALRAGVERHEVRFGDKFYDFFDPDWNSVFGFLPFDYPGYGPSSEGINQGYYLEDAWQASGRLLLTLGLRYDHFHNKPLADGVNAEFKEWKVSPKATGTYLLSGDSLVTLSVYQAFRAPSQPEIFWWSNPNVFSGGLTLPDGVLKAEKSDAVELTYQHQLASGRIRLAAWHYEVDDYIMLRFDPRAYIAYNYGKATLSGFSADGRMNVTPWLNVSASAAYQRTRKSGDFLDPEERLDAIDYIPEWKLFAGADVRLPRGSLLSVNMRYVGEREALYFYGGFGRPERRSIVRIDDYVLFDLGLKVPVGRNVVLGLHAENVFDEAYEEQFGFPMPGRVYGADVRVSF